MAARAGSRPLRPLGPLQNIGSNLVLSRHLNLHSAERQLSRQRNACSRPVAGLQVSIESVRFTAVSDAPNGCHEGPGRAENECQGLFSRGPNMMCYWLSGGQTGTGRLGSQYRTLILANFSLHFSIVAGNVLRASGTLVK